MTVEQKVKILSVITTRNEAGKHFLEIYDYDELKELEKEGLLEIHERIHSATGLKYSEEYNTVQLTQEGIDLVEVNC
jgi:hypothetical protein